MVICSRLLLSSIWYLYHRCPSLFFFYFSNKIEKEGIEGCCMCKIWRGSQSRLVDFKMYLLMIGDDFDLRIYLGHCPVSLLLVQRICLGGKWCANMINRGCRPGCGCVAWLLLNAVNPRLAERYAVEGEGEVCSSIMSHWGGEGGGRGTREGCCSRDHQSWRITIAKNKALVFSSLWNEFLWVSFYRSIFRRTVS